MNKKVLKNEYFVSVSVKIMLVLLSFINSMIINRYLGTYDKGIYAYILNFSNILNLILGLGIGQSYIFFKRKYGEEIKQKFVNIFWFQLFLYVFVLIIINIFTNNYIINVAIIISILIEFNSQVIFVSLIYNVNYRNIISLISTLFYTIILLVIYFRFNKNLNIAILSIFLRYAFDSVYSIVKFKLLPNTLKIDFMLIKEILKFSMFPMLASLMIIFNYSIDTIILKIFVNYDSIGIYSLGVTLAGMIWIIPDAFKDVLFNKTAKDDSILEIKFAIKANVCLCVIIIIGFWIFGRSFISFVYGKDFVNAYNVSLILFFGCIPMIFFKLINTLYISIGKQQFTFFVLLISVLSNIVFNFITIPFWNIEGSALSSVISYSICGIIFLVSFKHKYNLKYSEILMFNKLDIKKIKSLIWRENI